MALVTRKPFDPNGWAHQLENDQAEYLRRGVQFESATSVVSLRYSNSDRFYLVSASAAAATTVTFASATKNSGAQNIIINRTAGLVIAATNGGTMQGSVTQSAAFAATIWRSDGASWWRLYSSEAVADPLDVNVLNVGSLSVSGAAVFSRGVTLKSSLSISGSVAFGTQPNFPNGAVTSITGGAYIAYAGNLFYEMSPGASTIQLIIPDASTVRGQQISVKIKNGSTGTVLVSPSVGKIEPQSATGSSTVTLTGQFEYATFVAGQTDWWIV